LLAALELLAQGNVMTQPPQSGRGVTMQASTASRDVTQRKDWPKKPAVLSGILRRLAPSLRAVGVRAEFDRVSGGRTRLITITLTKPRKKARTAKPSPGAASNAPRPGRSSGVI